MNNQGWAIKEAEGLARTAHALTQGEARVRLESPSIACPSGVHRVSIGCPSGVHRVFIGCSMMQAVEELGRRAAHEPRISR